MLIDIVKKINKFEPKIRDVLLDILDEIEEQKKYYEQTVTKIEFNDLRKNSRRACWSSENNWEKSGKTCWSSNKNRRSC